MAKSSLAGMNHDRGPALLPGVDQFYSIAGLASSILSGFLTNVPLLRASRLVDRDPATARLCPFVHVIILYPIHHFRLL